MTWSIKTIDKKVDRKGSATRLPALSAQLGEKANYYYQLHPGNLLLRKKTYNSMYIDWQTSRTFKKYINLKLFRS